VGGELTTRTLILIGVAAAVVFVAVLLIEFGFGLIVAGVFAPDPTRGYPPGAASEALPEPTWGHRVHHVVGGPVAFLALLGACVILSAQLQGVWRLYTLLTAAAGLTLTIWTALAWQRDAGNTDLVQRGLILVYWTWLVVVGVHLASGPT
jgi:hypothetical protein